MYKRLILYTFISILISSLTTLAQSPVNNRVDFLSPTTTDFVKYGNIHPALYTGQIGLAIPLVTGKDNDFNIPVTINYNSEGFKPNRPSGPVGQNWYLSVAGAITRKVNGAPDDSQGRDATCTTCSASDRVAIGFYEGVKATPINKSNAFTFTSGAIDPQFFWNMGYDYQPDEFSFNFMGYSGKFFIANDGSVQVLSKSAIKVDLSSFPSQRVDALKVMPSSSTIVLTTPDGYVYTFGGGPQNLEYSFPLYHDGSVLAASDEAVINTWNLTRIVAPNGKEANFTYVAHDPTITDTEPIDGSSGYAASANNSFILNEYVNTSVEADQTNTGGGGLSGSYSSSLLNTDPSYSITKTCYLQSITTGNFTINFSYSPKVNKFYNNTNVFNQYNLQLNNISLTNNVAEVVKQINFTYSYLGSNPRHFLTALKESDKPAYSFLYYNTTTLPPAETRGIDHWGFWNGGMSTLNSSLLIPTVSWDANGNETITSNERDPSSSYFNTGLLQQVTYPTGGYSAFQYEPNSYSERLQRISTSNFLPTVVTINANTGGARVSQISDYTSAATVNVKTYKYIKNYISNSLASTTSSGFLLDFPRYGIYLSFNYAGGATQQDIWLHSSSFNTNYNTNENFINYAEVTEVTNGNGYAVYKFSNYDSNPDISDYNEKDVDPSVSSSVSNLNLYKNYVGYHLNDRSVDRGNLLFTGYYDTNFKLIKSQQNNYPVFNPASTSYAVAILPGSGTFAQSFKIYEDVPQVASTAFSDVSQNSSYITKNTYFVYDPVYKYLTQESFLDSKAKQNTTVYKHPPDFPSIQPYTDMVTKNIISPVIEQTDLLQGAQILDSKVNYAVYNTLDLPSSIQKQIGSQSTVTSLLFNNYDASGNLLQQQVPSGMMTSYKWGYNSQYPIAKVTNATNDEFYFQNFEESTGSTVLSGISHTGHNSSSSSLVGWVTPDTKSYVISYWYLISTGWKFSGELPYTTNYTMTGGTAYDDVLIFPADAQVSTYNYDPTVGMTSSIDPKGETTFYEYDAFYRLMNIKDKDGNIIKHIDYHYHGQ